MIRQQKTAICQGCGGTLLSDQLELGSQTLCNRFLHAHDTNEFAYQLTLSVCSNCGLLQIPTPPPIDEIAPRFPWIMYNEPEMHLDHLTDLLLNLTQTTKCPVAAGVSYKDDTTLERLRDRGVESIWRITPHELGLNSEKVEIETVQERLKPDRAAAICIDHGRPGLLVVRHVLEHTHETGTFLAAIRELSGPESIIVFEVPDCSTVFATKDYSTIWEEHTLYFTPTTLRVCLESHGFEILKIENYPYPLENSLVAIVKLAVERGVHHTEAEKKAERERALKYIASFQSEKESCYQFFSEYRHKGGRIALLGAGHLTCTFVNLFGLQEFIECIIDDDSNRQGLFMPGSRLPIVPSTVLREGWINLCLLGLNPMNEDKVIARNIDFLDSGGKFSSIFPVSRHALRRFIDECKGN